MVLSSNSKPLPSFPASVPIGSADADEPGVAALESRVSERTRSQYESHVRRFRQWQGTLRTDVDEGAGEGPISVADLVDYLQHEAARINRNGDWAVSASTARGWVDAIDHLHRTRGRPPPGTSEVVQRILRGLAAEREPREQLRHPVMLEDLRTILRTCLADGDRAQLRDWRDAAILSSAWLSGLSAKNLGELRCADVITTGEGMALRVPSREGSTKGARVVALLPRSVSSASCAACLISRWIHLLQPREPIGHQLEARVPLTEGHFCNGAALQSEVDFGALFRVIRGNRITAHALSDDAIRKVFSHRAHQATLSEAGLAFGSLRLGFIAEAVKAGTTRAEIIAQIGDSPSAVYTRFHREFKLPAFKLDI